MGVKLDWDIESEQGKRKQHKEDFQHRKRRYLGIFRLLLIIVLFLCAIVGIAYAVWQRWHQVNTRLEDILTETVKAEVAALRIGDYESYINLQRSATDAWLVTQDNTYAAYQQLKITDDITLSGNVRDVEIDGQRGRVQVEEIIGGVPYVQTWFYWRYPEPDGWRHVPPDYTFWGDEARIEKSRFTVRYRMMGTPVATAIAESVEAWLNDACSIVSCVGLPPLTIDIVADPLPEARWASSEPDSWQMVMASPYLQRARADKPFDTPLQIEIATLLAERLVDKSLGNGQPVYPHDVHFLRSSLVAWLVGRFVQLNPNTYLIESLIANYNISSVGQLLSILQPTSDIDILSVVIGVPSLANTNLDWRDFIEWRLNTEIHLIEIGDETNWQRLYDFRDEAVRQIAYSRYNTNAIGQVAEVLGIAQAVTADGTSQLQVRVRISNDAGSREEIVLFNLVNNIWLRAS